MMNNVVLHQETCTSQQSFVLEDFSVCLCSFLDNIWQVINALLMSKEAYCIY